SVIVVMPVILVAMVARLGLGRLHEVHRPVAGMVLVTVLAPMLLVSRRYMQINRLRRWRTDHHRYRLHHHWLGVHHRWRRSVADHDLTIHARHDLAADHGIHTHTLRLCCRHQQRAERDGAHNVPCSHRDSSSYTPRHTMPTLAEYGMKRCYASARTVTGGAFSIPVRSVVREFRSPDPRTDRVGRRKSKALRVLPQPARMPHGTLRRGALGLDVLAAHGFSLQTVSRRR